ncbi:MarR family transcriptional regulator [Nocardioides mangrovicus]|uniref:MarR family transcriptional regulator n=1 Tax=Nocardioides mangrovicus TaxID=2478913 RepID=A0A3L8P586_9ACTN|nr:MarR family transcriptional regulator [Nocardioides mangrovicus]RLV49933.1 MarR family transcriptional regulator [Nocardioides mangrovicus]
MSVATERSAPLADLLCFDLYAASRAVTARYRALLAELDLTYPQYLVLLLLGDAEQLSVRRIAADLHLDHSTLTPLLRRLERSGLLTRSRNADDERVVDIALTARGRQVVERFGEVQDGMREAMGLSPREAHSLQEALRRLATSVEG